MERELSNGLEPLAGAISGIVGVICGVLSLGLFLVQGKTSRESD